MIKILLADNQDLIRSSIKLLLSDVGNIEVIGEAKNNEDIIKLGRQLKPDIIMMSLAVSDIIGLEVIRRLLRGKSLAKLLVLSSHRSALIPARLVEQGIAGYLTMQVNHEEMVRAIYSVHAGDMYIDALVAKRISSGRLLADNNYFSPLIHLSQRELQVLIMIAYGMDSNEIAENLFLSKKTIHGYLCYVLKKIGAKTNVDAVHIAIKSGVIDL